MGTVNLSMNIGGSVQRTFLRLLKELQKELTVAADRLRGIGDSTSAKALEAINKSAGDLRHSIWLTNKDLNTAQKGLSGYAKDWKVVRDAYRHFSKDSTAVGAELESAERWTNRVSKSVHDLDQKLRLAGGGYEKYSSRLKWNNVLQGIQEKNLKLTASGFEILNKEGAAALGISEKQYNQLKTWEAATSNYDKTLAKVGGTSTTVGKAYAELGAKLGTTNEQFRSWSPVVDRTNTALQRSSTALASTNKSLAANVRQTSLAAVSQQVLDGNIKLTSQGFKILNKEGLTAFNGLTEESARKAGLLSTSFSSWDKALANANAKSAEHAKVLEQMGNKYGTAPGQISLYQKAMNKAGEAIAASRAKLIKNMEALRQTTGLTDKQSQALTRFDEKMTLGRVTQSKFNQSLGGTKKQMTETTKTTSLFRKAIDRVALSIKTLASYTFAASFVYGIANAFMQGIRSIIDYSQALKNLQAITRATEGEVRGMGTTIETVARDTKFNTSEVAQAMVTLGQAGLSASESVQAIDAVAMLATGTLTDMSTTTDLLTTAINAFEQEALDAGKSSDIFASAVNRSKLNIDKLRIAFNYVGPVAKDVGVGLEETSASMMVLADRGIRASTIGTGLRQVFSRLMRPTSSLTEALAEQGLTIAELDPKTVGYRKVLENLTKILWDSDKKAVSAAKAFKIFGLRGSASAIALANAFKSGDYDKAIGYLYEVGSASRMAETQIEGLELKAKNLADRMKLVALAIGKAGVADAIGILLDVLRGLASFIESLIDNQWTRFILQMGVMSTAILALIKYTKTLAIAFVAMLDKIAAAALAFSVANPELALLAAGIAYVVLAIREYLQATDKFVKAAEDQALAAKSNLDIYNHYKKEIAELQAKQEEGIDVSKAYEATVKRLNNAQKNLKLAYDASNESFEKNLSLLNDAISQEEDKYYDALATAIGGYSREVKEAQTVTGLQNTALSLLYGTLNMLNQAVELILWPIKKFGEGFMQLIGYTVDAKNSFTDYLSAIFRGAADVDAGSEALENQSKAIKELAQKYKDLDPSDRLAAIKADLLDMQERGIDLGMSMDVLAQKIDVAAKEMASSLSDGFMKELMAMEHKVPESTKSMYTKLDALRQADYVKAMLKLEKEIDAIIKKNNKMGTSHEETQAQIAAYRADGLAKFFEDQNKELLSERQLLEQRLRMVKQYIADSEEQRDREIAIAEKTAASELNIAKKLGNDESAIIEKRNNRIEQIEKDHIARVNALRMSGIEESIKLQDQYIEDYSKALDGIVEAEADAYAKRKEVRQSDREYELDMMERNMDLSFAIAEAELEKETKLHKTHMTERGSQYDIISGYASAESKERLRQAEQAHSRYKVLLTDSEMAAESSLYRTLDDWVRFYNQRDAAADEAERNRSQNNRRTLEQMQEDAATYWDQLDAIVSNRKGTDTGVWDEHRKAIARTAQEGIAVWGNMIISIEDGNLRAVSAGTNAQQKIRDELSKTRTHFETEEEKKRYIQQKYLEYRIRSVIQNLEEEFRLIDGSTSQEKAVADKRLVTYQEWYNKKVALAQKASEDEQFAEDETTEYLKKNREEVVEIEKEKQKRRAEAVAEATAEIETLLDQETEKYNDALNKIKDINDKLVDDAYDRENSIRDIMQSSMSEQEKYIDDQERVYELLSRAKKEAAKGNYDQALQYTKDAVSLAEDLNREVTEGEEVVVSAEDAKETALKAVNDVYDAREKILKAQKKAEIDNAVQAKKNVEQLSSLMEQLHEKQKEIAEQGIQLNVQHAITELEVLRKVIDGMDKTITWQMQAEGSETLPFHDKLEEMEKSLAAFQELVSSIGSIVMIHFRAFDGSDEGTELSQALENLKAQVKDLTDYIASESPDLFVDTEKTKAKLEYLKKILEAIAKTWRVSVPISVKGTSDLERTLDLLQDIANYDGKTVTVTTVHRTQEVGYAVGGLVSKYETGGQVAPVEYYAEGGPTYRRKTGWIPGEGYKDDVPAMLMRGEFVVRKDAVKRYGLDLMNMINSGRYPENMVPHYASGGTVDWEAFRGNAFSMVASGNDTSAYTSTVPNVLTGTQIQTILESMIDKVTSVVRPVNASFDFSTVRDMAGILGANDIPEETFNDVVSTFNNAVVNMADGGDTTSVQEELQAKQALIREDYDNRIQQARDMGLDDVAFELENERDAVEAAIYEMIQELLDLRDEYMEWVQDAYDDLVDSKQDALEAAQDAQEEYAEEIAELQIKKSQLQGTFNSAGQSLDRIGFGGWRNRNSNARAVLVSTRTEALAQIKGMDEAIATLQNAITFAYSNALNTYKELQTRTGISATNEASKFKNYANLQGSKGLVEARSEHNEGVQGALSSFKEMIYEVRSLQAEMKQELYDVEQEYSTTKIAATTQFLAGGGQVPFVKGAKAGMDSVRAMLMPGEWVIREKIVKQFGPDFFDNLNKGMLKFADGGQVPGASLTPVVNQAQSAAEEFSATLNLGVNGKNYPLKGKTEIVKELLRELKKMGGSVV